MRPAKVRFIFRLSIHQDGALAAPLNGDAVNDFSGCLISPFAGGDVDRWSVFEAGDLGAGADAPSCTMSPVSGSWCEGIWVVGRFSGLTPRAVRCRPFRAQGKIFRRRLNGAPAGVSANTSLSGI